MLTIIADNLAALMGPGEAERAEELYAEGLRARRNAPREMSLAPPLTGLGILRDRQGRHSEAEKLFRRALESATDDPRDTMLPLQNLAVALANQRRFSEASDCYERAIRVARELADPSREGELRVGLAVTLANAEDFEKAHEQFALLIGSAHLFGIPEARAASLVRDLGATAARLGRADEAASHFRSARRRYEGLGDRLGVAGCLLDEAGVSGEDAPEARIDHVREALEVLRGTRYHDRKLDAHQRLFWALLDHLRVDEAMEAFAKERRLLRRLGRTRTLARRLAEVGGTLANFRLHRRALGVLRRSSYLYERLGDEASRVRSRNDLANSLVDLGRVGEAREVYSGNLETARKSKNRALKADALLNLGELSRREGRTEDALARLREANKLDRELHDLGGLALGLNNLGLTLKQAGDTEGAQLAFGESLEVATRAHDEAAVARALSSLGTTAFERRDYPGAQGFYERAVSHAVGGGERGLGAELGLNLAAAVRQTRGLEEAEAVVERAVDAAQEVLHYDTAYRAAAEMARWFAEAEEMEKAGEWSAHAVLFGPLLGDGQDAWGTWVVSLLSSLSPEEGRWERFLDAMESTCGRLEDENDLDGQLVRVVDALRSMLP